MDTQMDLCNTCQEEQSGSVSSVNNNATSNEDPTVGMV